MRQNSILCDHLDCNCLDPCLFFFFFDINIDINIDIDINIIIEIQFGERERETVGHMGCLIRPKLFRPKA